MSRITDARFDHAYVTLMHEDGHRTDLAVTSSDKTGNVQTYVSCFSTPANKDDLLTAAALFERAALSLRHKADFAPEE